MITGIGKVLVYLRIALHSAVHYLIRPGHWGWRPWRYARFLHRALRLLLAFRHGKVVHVASGYKIHLYLPAYPSPAFFHAIEGKLLRQPPGPITVVYSITRACRYHCPHCYQRHDHGNDLPDAMLQRVACELRDSGVSMFDIEGGEPFLRCDRLSGLLHAIGPQAECWANTSGDGVTRERLDQLREAGLYGLMISIHSPDADTHDRFTGVNGSFETACAAIRLCRECNILAAVNSVLGEEELEQGRLDELMQLAGECGAQFVQLIHPKPSGAWLSKQDGLQRSQKLIDAIRAKHLEYNSRARQQAPALAAQVFEEDAAVFGCTAGAVDRFYVNASGEVQPCEFLNLSFGNLNDDTWQTIFSRMRAAFPTPCSDWLCCTQAERIRERIDATSPRRTPLPWPQTRELLQGWQRGPETPLYKDLGVYR